MVEEVLATWLLKLKELKSSGVFVFVCVWGGVFVCKQLSSSSLYLNSGYCKRIARPYVNMAPFTWFPILQNLKWAFKHKESAWQWQRKLTRKPHSPSLFLGKVNFKVRLGNRHYLLPVKVTIWRLSYWLPRWEDMDFILLKNNVIIVRHVYKPVIYVISLKSTVDMSLVSKR